MLGARRAACMLRTAPLLLCLAVVARLAHCQTRQSGRGASVALTAKWGSTATVLEAAEFLVCFRAQSCGFKPADLLQQLKLR